MFYYINKGRLPGAENKFLIEERTVTGSIAAYYTGYYDHRYRRYTLYPKDKISTLAENYTKKRISALDVKFA